MYAHASTSNGKRLSNVKSVYRAVETKMQIERKFWKWDILEMYTEPGEAPESEQTKTEA
jgi:hypothetical protein